MEMLWLCEASSARWGSHDIFSFQVTDVAVNISIIKHHKSQHPPTEDLFSLKGEILDFSIIEHAL